MPKDSSELFHFDSWQEMLAWLPQATEGQLITVFVWASDQQGVPAGELARLQQVRKDSFDLLVNRTRSRLRSYLLRRTGCRDVHQVEDIVQEVLIQVYCRAEQFDPQRSFWGWLYRIAHNKYIDMMRRLRPGVVGAGQSGFDDSEQWLQKLSDQTPAPDADILEQEKQQRLAEVIARLPATQQLIVQLKRDGVKGTDISRQIGKSEAYVSQSYHEAVEIIRERMGE